MNQNIDVNDNEIKALKKLRALPRGSNVETRIAAIKDLLGDKEAFSTLRYLRWPKGIHCPFCKGTNIVHFIPDPSPQEDQNLKRHYKCLDCEKRGEGGIFDDFTGLPISSIRTLKQWMLCWYLLGFCSIIQIAQILGLSIDQVRKIAEMAGRLHETKEQNLDADFNLTFKKKQQSTLSQFRKTTEYQEDLTKSASKGIFKPGPKSKY